MRLLCLCVLLGAAQLQAQNATPALGMLRGVVTATDSMPLRGAWIRATSGSRTVEARSGADGAYRIESLAAGEWVVSVRRIGYSPQVDTLAITAGERRRDFRLAVLPTALDPVLVASRWIGVRGVIVDARDQRPLDGATIELSGGRVDRATSDSAGAFAAERIRNTDVVLRVKRPGYAPRTVMARVPEVGYVEVEIALDTLRGRLNQVAEGDLDVRLRWAAADISVVPGDEIEMSTARDLMSALREAPSVRRKGIHIGRGVPCVFVNGYYVRGVPLSAIAMDSVEFVEVYPWGSDYSETLAKRAPGGGVCALSRRQARLMGRPGEAQYVVIWTRGR